MQNLVASIIKLTLIFGLTKLYLSKTILKNFSIINTDKLIIKLNKD